MKKIITSVFCIFLSAFCYLSAAVGDTFTSLSGDFNFNYTVTASDEVTLASLVNGNPTAATYSNIVVPATVTYSNATYRVTAVADSAFVAHTNLKGELTLGKNVENVGKYAFKGAGLTALEFDGASDGTSMLNYINEYAFYNCTSLAGDLTLPAALTTVARQAFRDCIFDGELRIKGSISKTFATLAFDQSKAQFSSIYVEEEVLHTISSNTIDTTDFKSSNGVIYLKNEALISKYKSDTYWGVFTNFVLHENYNGFYSITYLDGDGNELESYYVVKSSQFVIASYMYNEAEDALIYDWVDEDGVTYTASQTVTPDENMVLSPVEEKSAFIYYNHGDYTIQYSIDPTESNAIVLDSISAMNSGVTEIDGLTVFSSITPKSGDYKGEVMKIVAIGDNAFKSKNLTGALIIGRNVKSIGASSFYSTSISSLSFEGTSSSASLQTIGEFAFYNCASLKGDLSLPAALTTVSRQAFKFCAFNGKLTIKGSTSKTFGNSAFEQTKPIQFSSIYVEEDVLHTISSNTFNTDSFNTANGVVYLVNDELISKYKNDTYWSAFDTFKTVDDDDTEYIPEYTSISFNSNGGSGEMESLSDVEVGSSVILPDATFTRDGYEIIGWATSASGSRVYSLNQEIDITSNSPITLYAYWDMIESFDYEYKGYSFECLLDEGVTPETAANSRYVTIVGISALSGASSTITIPTTATLGTLTYQVNFSTDKISSSAISGKKLALADGETLAAFTVSEGMSVTISSEFVVNSLELHSNKDEVSQLDFSTGDVKVSELKIVKTFDNAKYYFLSLPFDCKVSDIVLSDMVANGSYYGSVYGVNWEMYYYDEEYRSTEYATSGGGFDKDWKVVGSTETLKAFNGYLIATNNKSCTFTFEKTFTTPTSLTDGGSISVQATLEDNSGNATVLTHRGFNLISLPSFRESDAAISYVADSQYSAEEVSDLIVTIPIGDGSDYSQTLSSLVSVEPHKSFFVQVEYSGDIYYNYSNGSPSYIQSFNAPMSVAAQSTPYAVVDLLQEGESLDQTVAAFYESASSDYWIGYDMEKWSSYTDRAQVYIVDKGYDLAVNARTYRVSDIVYLEVYVPAAGEYTLALRNSDSYLLEDAVTGDVASSLTISASEAGIIQGQYRIVINRVSTSLDEELVNDVENDVKVYAVGGEIMIDNISGVEHIELYSISGQLLRLYNTSNSTQLTVRGLTSSVYILRIDGDSHKVVVK